MSSYSAIMGGVLKHPPPGLNYVVNVRHSMTMALLAGMFASFLVPMLIALFFFASQHACRKTHIFWLNVGALILGILEGIYLVAIEVRSALHPPLSDTFVFAWYILSFYTPIFVESILIFRLSAVYAAETTTPGLRRFVLGFPIFWKVVRFAVATLLLTVWITNILEQGIPVETGLLGWSRFPYPKIGWGFQLLDNTFCSVAFLTRLGYRIRSSTKLMNGGDRRHRRNVTARLRTIFFIALSNYAVPAVLGATHLIIAIINDRWSEPAWMYLCSYLMILNNYTTIMGVVFATVWATSREWAFSQSVYSSEISCAASSRSFGSGSLRWSSRSSKTGSLAPSLLSPKSAHFLSGSCPSTIQTPLSPDFPYPVDHYYPGYNPNVKFSPAEWSPASDGTNGFLRIHVERRITRGYDIEAGSIEEQSEESLPELDDPVSALSPQEFQKEDFH